MRHPTIIVALLGVLLPGGRADACPKCNLGFLPESVKSSRNIFLGRVVRPLKQERVEVRVEKVLRGPLKKDQLTDVPVRDPVWPIRLINVKRDIGKLLLLSDPVSKSGDTVFPVLDPIFEEEVRLLMQSKPRITSVAHAIRMIQGVSDVSYKAGLKYIRRHRKAATEPLIRETERIRTAVFADRKADRYSNQASERDIFRLATLVRALLSGVSVGSPGYAKSRAYVRSRVKSFLGHIWQDRPSRKAVSSRRTMFLNWLIENTANNGRLRREIRRRLVRGYPSLKGQGIVAAVYTLVVNEMSPPSSFRSRNHAGKNEAMAAGLYHAAVNGQLSETRQVAILERAAALANSAALKKRISEEILRLQTPSQ
jgi:hypothetical protein